MNNSIDQFSIAELLDGRYFYIPAYQRGYRWTEDQVSDLLRDLLSFYNQQKQDGDFYCLQPVIVRPITDTSKIKEIFGESLVENVSKKGAWEVIDGQQRLTSIYIIYKYLLEKKGWDAENLKEEEDGRELYKIHYATRKLSTDFLENLSLKFVDNKGHELANDNIDFYHISNAYKYIDNWIKSTGKEINVKFGKSGSLSEVRDPLFSIFNCHKNIKGASVQVLWYEINEEIGSEKNVISEFQKINTGKIRLTDAELIKGLFLLKRNFNSSTQYIKQSQLAIEWEFIENTFHQNSFWHFLQKKGVNMSNRIDLLFSLVYKIVELENCPESEIKKRIEDIDKRIEDPRQSEIFRYYYSQFEGKSDDDLQILVAKAWEKVMTLFRLLDDWFNSPILYNYIGLLCQCGEDISRLVIHFNSMEDDTTSEDFEKYLVERIQYYLRKITIKAGQITNTYSPKERSNIFNLLLTLNIHLLNEQHRKMVSDVDIYKFPFDVFNEQNWDIEHIDSYHTNTLKRNDDKVTWVQTAIDDLDLNDTEKLQIDNFRKNNKYDDAIVLLKNIAKEVDVDDVIKNSIGNLTLLDSQTNKRYGNALFITKRKIIIDNLMQGVFIPTATQFVFAKFFDEKGTNRSLWSEKDMEAYHKYIIDMTSKYITNIEN